MKPSWHDEAKALREQGLTYQEVADSPVWKAREVADWPDSVVAERLAIADRMRAEAGREMDAWMKEQWLS